MTATKNIKNVPTLRFKEFRDKWVEKSLGEIFNINAGGDINPQNVSSIKTQKFQYPIYANAEKNKGFYAYSDIYKVEAGSITIAGRGANLGIAHARDHKFYPIVRLLVLKPINNENIYFSEYAINRINLLIESTGVPQLTVPQVSNYFISIPALPEQQKIAAFLSSVDEKIQQLTRKKELLEQYKKGVMQQLLSGKLRFKDENGKAFPKWEEKRLGEVCEVYDGTHQTPKYVNEGIPFYSVEHITANQFSSTKYISREVFEKEKNRLEKGDILMTKIGDIGTSKLIDWNVEASFYVSLALIKQSPLIYSNYLNQYISSKEFQLELWKRTIHVAFPKKINLGEIGNCNVKIPKIEEQQKIATFLSNIDTKIESISNQITQAQSFKKGLLQQMFV